MTFGSSDRASRLAIALILCIGWGVAGLAVKADQAPQVQPSWTLEQLMLGLSKIKNATTNFIEDQYIGILTKPLHSSGVLVYVAPSRLEKDSLVPTRQSVIIDGDKLTVRQANGQTRTVTLQDHPEIGAFVESLRSTLSGDLGILSRFYDVGFTGSADHWQLTLEPSDQKVRKLVKTIRIEGSNFSLSSVEILHADGDRSVMTMTKSSP